MTAHAAVSPSLFFIAYPSLKAQEKYLSMAETKQLRFAISLDEPVSVVTQQQMKNCWVQHFARIDSAIIGAPYCGGGINYP